MFNNMITIQYEENVLNGYVKSKEIKIFFNKIKLSLTSANIVRSKAYKKNPNCTLWDMLMVEKKNKRKFENKIKYLALLYYLY